MFLGEDEGNESRDVYENPTDAWNNFDYTSDSSFSDSLFSCFFRDPDYNPRSDDSACASPSTLVSDTCSVVEEDALSCGKEASSAVPNIALPPLPRVGVNYDLPLCPSVDATQSPGSPSAASVETLQSLLEQKRLQCKRR